MKICSTIIVGAVFIVFSHLAGATQADDTTITIDAHTAGATPFISQLTLTASDTTVINSIQFTITPKAGSVTRPLSGTYSHDYLVSRGFLQPPSEEIFLPVYGLYDSFTNTVSLTYYFLDGSSKQANITITTAAFDDPCQYDNPTFLQHRSSTALSYDYIMVKGGCSSFSPAIVDTDGALRWVGTAGFTITPTTFFDNAVYLPNGPGLYRIDLDGTVTKVGDYSAIGVTYFHHNFDPGKVGLLLEANTLSYYESTVIEVDAVSGEVLKIWNLADIISAAMTAGGDDPSQFVHPAPTDWFHNNSVAYNRADDSVIVSSRENFLICLDYETGAIKWILGDPTKKWHQFPSWRNSYLRLAAFRSVGQHAISVHGQIFWCLITVKTAFSRPPGRTQLFEPRKYVGLERKNLPRSVEFRFGQSLWCPFCGSVYEDAPFNYLIDFTFIDGVTTNSLAQLIGVNDAGETVFRYQYHSASGCIMAFNAIPVHLENTKFPTVGPQALNLSTRGTISSGDNALIGGFIVTGTEDKKLVLRELGHRSTTSGFPVLLADPILNA
jgi:hypothetical protein